MILFLQYGDEFAWSEIENVWTTLADSWPKNLKIILHFLISMSGVNSDPSLLPYVSHRIFTSCTASVVSPCAVPATYSSCVWLCYMCVLRWNGSWFTWAEIRLCSCWRSWCVSLSWLILLAQRSLTWTTPLITASPPVTRSPQSPQVNEQCACTSSQLRPCFQC